MSSKLSDLAQIHTAVIFREEAPQQDPEGNVRALAIRNLAATKPLNWQELPRILVQDKYLAYCLQPGDVVIPSRGDYYKAWLFEGADEPVFPLGQLNVIRTQVPLDARYLVWFLNQKSAQVKIASTLTGTGIKALTKTALLSLSIEVPPMTTQRRIAELDQTTRRIVAIRHRMNQLDMEEIAYLTQQVLREGDVHA